MIFLNNRIGQHKKINGETEENIRGMQSFLISFLSHFAPISYNRDSDQLTKWLESSQQTLNYWKEQSLNVSQDLDTIRSNINNFFVSCNTICSGNCWLEKNIRGKLGELV